MKYLLDTVSFLWAVYGESEKLGENARPIIENLKNILYLSAASSWEIVLKHGVNKLPLPSPPKHFIVEHGSKLNFIPLPVTQEHTFAVTDLPFHHKDPFDRLLIAQAQIEDLAVITPDAIFRKYEIKTVW